MVVNIRGIDFQENDNNDMGLEFVNLSHRYGFQCPNWPYFRDVAIERKHYMAKSGVLSQTITTTMHVTTHIDAPAHVVQGTPFIDEVPLPHFFGSGHCQGRRCQQQGHEQPHPATHRHPPRCHRAGQLRPSPGRRTG